MSRQKKCVFMKHKFGDEYERLCQLNNACPLPLITANLKDSFIDVNADRIRLNEWDPIFGAIKVNESLKYLALRSYWQPITEG